jgi:DNA-binding CsgD family transcriptional regulator
MTHGTLFLETPLIVELISVCIELIVVFGVIGYSIGVTFYYARHIHNPPRKTLARIMAIFLVIALPGIVNDLLHISPVEFFPMLYCGLSILLSYHLLKHNYFHHSSVSGPIIPDDAFFDQYNISSREKEIVPLILQGESNQRISDTLCISPNTLKTHIRNIYAKFGVKSRVEFITFMRDTSFPSSSDK